MAILCPDCCPDPAELHEARPLDEGARMALHRRLIRTVKTALDVTVLAGALWLAFLARFEGALPEPMRLALLVGLLWVVPLKYTTFAVLGVPRLTWRYVSLVEAKRIALALAAVTLALVGV